MPYCITKSAYIPGNGSGEITDMAKYTIYDVDDEYRYKAFRTTTLNPAGKTGQRDGLFQVLKVMRPDLSDRDIVTIIVDERIRRHEMDLDTTSIRRLIKNNVPGYASVKVNKKYTLLQVMDMCDSGKMIIRIGTELLVYDYDTGAIYTGISTLYTQIPVTEYWREV